MEPLRPRIIAVRKDDALDDETLKILLIEDDEDDYILTRDKLLDSGVRRKFRLDWERSYEQGLAALNRGEFDACLLDYRLGEKNGLELLREAVAGGCETPIILLTGQGDYDVDMETMKAGGADYLTKGHITAPLLERVIRYSMERKRSECELRESEQKLRSLSRLLLTTQENERKRIAGELHDSVGQCLSAIKFSVESAMLQMEQGVLDPAALRPVISLVQQAMEEVRSMITDLRPSILDDLGIITTIGWFCREYNRVYPGIALTRNLTVDESDVPEALKIVIFRIIQEALHNVAKHSNASEAVISLKKTGSLLDLAIEDNGKGFAAARIPRQNQGRFGLTNMRERAELSGGRFIIEAREAKGASIRACWPVQSHDRENPPPEVG